MKKKTVRTLITTLLIASIPAVAFNVMLISGHIGDSLTAWASVPPIIDGMISTADEWDGAAQVAVFTGSYAGSVFYVMNDANNLYLALKVVDSDFDDFDSMELRFDNDHDGVLTERDDMVKAIKTEFRDGHYNSQIGWILDFDQADGSSGAGTLAGANFFEISHPLNSGDPYDFSLSAGDTIGFSLSYYDDGIVYWYGVHPEGSRYVVNEQWLYGDIIIAEPEVEYVLSAWASTIPIIDGTISPGEWEDADTVAFTIGIPYGIPQEYHECILYVKNDHTNLYLAWVVMNEDFDTDDMGRFHFDNDHDGVREVGDDAINCFGSGVCRDDFLWSLSTPFPPYAERSDVSDGGTEDVVGAASYTGGIGDYTFEISHVLDTADDSHDFSLSAGDTVGLDLEFFDPGVGAGFWPTPTLPAYDWADIVIASFVDVTNPVADAGPDQTVDEDSLMTFDGSGSSDNVGIVEYLWEFTDGGTPQSLMGVNPTYTFVEPGIYTVTLTVSDAAGNSATDTVTVTVLTPEERAQRLIETIETYDMPQGTKKGLQQQLDEAIHLLNPGNEIGAVHKLMDFINKVEALKDKKLTLEQANYLIAEAQGIIDNIQG
jgi:PKD repeat protein